MKDTDYELLVAIANQGYIDTVMDAARAAKAGGGTVIHAKGTGMELAKKYLGVSLVEEKEVILIVTKSREKNQIMKAIMEQAGLDSKERTIVFSLPVTSVAGYECWRKIFRMICYRLPENFMEFSILYKSFLIHHFQYLALH